MMERSTIDIIGPIFITPTIHKDSRGFFSETYKADALRAKGIDDVFVQDNHSLSLESGVVRGLHFQSEPFAQGKLVRVVRGSILDVAVDIRHGSPTYGRHVAVELSADNWKQLWVPPGFAHGFCTLVGNTEVVYKVTNYYSRECEGGIAWDDPALAIKWPVDPSTAILSDKDRGYPKLCELPRYFQYEK